jgi:hypothetical protein
MKRVLGIVAAAMVIAVVAVGMSAGQGSAVPPKNLLVGAVSFTSAPVQVPGGFVVVIATATCGTGYDVTGGGYTISPDPPQNPVVQVISSRVVASPPGWQVRALSEISAGASITAEAVCHPTS